MPLQFSVHIVVRHRQKMINHLVVVQDVKKCIIVVLNVKKRIGKNIRKFVKKYEKYEKIK